MCVGGGNPHDFLCRVLADLQSEALQVLLQTPPPPVDAVQMERAIVPSDGSRVIYSCARGVPASSYLISTLAATQAET